MSGRVLFEMTSQIAKITLANPERRNALSLEMYGHLQRLLEEIRVDPDCRALVIRGSEGNFAGGTDIHDFIDLRTAEQGVAYEARMRDVQGCLLELRVPVISVIEGVCVGGGLVMAALSDLAYCTQTAQFGSPIGRTLGNTLSATSIARLHDCFGRRRTNEMLMTGRLFTAREALDAGFVNAVFSDDELEDRLCHILEDIKRCAPQSLRSFKEFERRLDSGRLDVAVDDVYAEIYASSDFREGVSSFLEKRPAKFTGK